MRKRSKASGSRALSSRYCCIIGVREGSLMKSDAWITHRRRGHGTRVMTPPRFPGAVGNRGKPPHPQTQQRSESRRMQTAGLARLTDRGEPGMSQREMGGGQSELIERGLLLGEDLENLVETGNSKDFEKVGVNAAELELALDGADFLLEVDQLAECGAREVLDIAEVEQKILVAFVFNQAIELLAHFLDLLLGHDLGINETNDRHPVDTFQTKKTARALRHRGTPVRDGNRTEPRQRMVRLPGPARGPHRHSTGLDETTQRGENVSLPSDLPQSAAESRVL